MSEQEAFEGVKNNFDLLLLNYLPTYKWFTRPNGINKFFLHFFPFPSCWIPVSPSIHLEVPAEQAVEPQMPAHQVAARRSNVKSNVIHWHHRPTCFSMRAMKNHGHAKCANANTNGRTVWIATLKTNAANRRNSSANECVAIKRIYTVTWSATWIRIASQDSCSKQNI